MNALAILTLIQALVKTGREVATGIAQAYGAARAANITVIVDTSTGNVYGSEDEAAAAGVAPEHMVSDLPDDPVVLERLLNATERFDLETGETEDRIRAKR